MSYYVKIHIDNTIYVYLCKLVFKKWSTYNYESQQNRKNGYDENEGIISQLTDVIYLLCDAKDTNITMIMEQFTNLTCEERDSLHITFSHKNK